MHHPVATEMQVDPFRRHIRTQKHSHLVGRPAEPINQFLLLSISQAAVQDTNVFCSQAHSGR